MSTGKLAMSLDDIVKTAPRGAGGRGGRRGGRGGRGDRVVPTPQGPVGGINKSRNGKQRATVPTAPAPKAGGGEAKIMVSRLPVDVDEQALKDYFVTATDTGKPKSVIINYGANGRSLGTATITFFKQEQAVKAMSELDGMKIDRKPIKVEMMVPAAHVPATTAQASLAARVQPARKDKPKPATATKTSGRGRDSGRGRGRGRGGSNKAKKTVEEMDQEMKDYFPHRVNNDGNGDVTQTSGGGDIAMDDEML
ncbi:hypothetical protein BDV95DRAFT_596010 [Massariosphaeria phaeospora]|uniref:RRM domain-containing protein n=1 Tax=Massariosphaeria phaeospora TaxID=100035 RepID=A0A7C8I6S8_9PLEO|nr:hypothetical protein BDV95DRAFT_596010 [Massariosphaeria phaeospora]